MKSHSWKPLAIAALLCIGTTVYIVGQPERGRENGRAAANVNGVDATNIEYANRMLKEGRDTFRYDTFGCESFWGDALELHKAVAGAKVGGVGVIFKETDGSYVGEITVDNPQVVGVEPFLQIKRYAAVEDRQPSLAVR